MIPVFNVTDINSRNKGVKSGKVITTIDFQLKILDRFI